MYVDPDSLLKFSDIIDLQFTCGFAAQKGLNMYTGEVSTSIIEVLSSFPISEIGKLL